MGDSILRPHGDKRIIISRQEKELGIAIDSTLSPKWHIKKKVGEAYVLLTNLRVAFTHLDEDMIVMLQTVFKRPIREYAAVVWSLQWKKHVTKVMRIQRAAGANGIKLH